MEAIEQFRKIFWDAFNRPKLESGKFRSLWEHLEPVNDKVAGPFYNIYSQGECDYLFRDKQRFSFINSIEDFLEYSETIIRHYHQEIQKVEAETEAEKEDKQILLYQVDIKMELAHLAYLIQQQRFSLPDKG